MSLLQKYILELEEDVKLDELNLKEAALMLPAKKAKWVSRLMLEKAALNELLRKKERTTCDIVEELRKESPVKLALPTLQNAAERHGQVMAISNEVRDRHAVIEFLERVEKTMHSIGFDIKNLIELIKMETS